MSQVPGSWSSLSFVPGCCPCIIHHIKLSGHPIIVNTTICTVLLCADVFAELEVQFPWSMANNVDHSNTTVTMATKARNDKDAFFSQIVIFS